jgi:hypothetical protein
VTCGFPIAHPARSRRPCAAAGNSRLMGRARNRAKAAAASCRSQGCSVRADAHLLRPPRRLPRGDVRRDRTAKPAAITPPHLALSPPQSRRPPDALGSSLAPLPPLSPSSLPHEVPGSGLSAPVLPWPSKTTGPPRSIAESSRRPRTWSAEATLRPSARQPAGVPSAETWPSLPTQRQAEGPNRVAFERGDCGEPSGSAGQKQCATSADAFRIGSG